MSQEFERKLAVEMMATKLAKEYATDATVHHCLQAVLHGHVGLADGLAECIKALVEQKATMMKEVERLNDLVPVTLLLPTTPP